MVVTHVSQGTSHEGFAAEWREVSVLTVDGDLSAASSSSTRQTSTPRSRDSTSCSRRRRGWKTRQAKWTSAFKHFAARDWAALEKLIADDFFYDDRRRVVNGGIRHGRTRHMADMRGIAEPGREVHNADRHRDPRRRASPLTRYQRPRPAARGVLQPSCSPSLRSTPTTGSCRTSGSTSTTSMPPSRNSTPDTSPAKRPRSRTRGRQSRGLCGAQSARNPLTTPDWVNVDHRRATTLAW